MIKALVAVASLVLTVAVVQAAEVKVVESGAVVVGPMKLQQALVEENRLQHRGVRVGRRRVPVYEFLGAAKDRAAGLDFEFILGLARRVFAGGVELERLVRQEIVEQIVGQLPCRDVIAGE